MKIRGKSIPPYFLAIIIITQELFYSHILSRASIIDGAVGSSHRRSRSGNHGRRWPLARNRLDSHAWPVLLACCTIRPGLKVNVKKDRERERERQDTICIIIFTRYITLVIRLSGAVRVPFRHEICSGRTRIPVGRLETVWKSYA